MKQINISKNEAGQRLDKFLAKYMSKAPKSFFYKMLRKKNIVLNAKKASGSEKLVQGDEIKLFLSDETIEKFSENPEIENDKLKSAGIQWADRNLSGSDRIEEALEKLDIIYEDEHIILFNKPAGMLSQKAQADDISLVELLIAYMLKEEKITKEEIKTFRPGICNRLDRNTSGIVVAGKTLLALQAFNSAFKERSLHKYYHCIVWGEITKEKEIKGYLIKNQKNNMVQVFKEAQGKKRWQQSDKKKHYKNRDSEKEQFIQTKYKPLCTNGKITLLEVELMTGRSHQIRAHLASEGHPIIGDGKYGDLKANRLYRDKYNLKHQLLHAYKLVMPELGGELKELSCKNFEAQEPGVFREIILKEFNIRR